MTAPMPVRWRPWHVGGGAALVLFIVYVATLAPGVTFWDAGEFIAAAHSLGIPHPPGTPLFILLVHSWARLMAFVPYAVRTNLFSAACTATAAGLTAGLVARATRDPLSAIAAAITAGAMSSVWSNATETEVYAASLLLSLATIAAADRAGRSCSPRWRLLTAYLIALAVPLHLSALVASPAAIFLSSRVSDDAGGTRFDVPWAIAITSVAILSMGIGVVSLPLVVVAMLGLVGAFVASRIVGRGSSRRQAVVRGLALLGAVAVASSALAFMLIRARFDPAINQGNPSTIPRLLEVVGRRQYAVQPVWPRQAPLWLQIANWFDYADWQVALSLGPSVIPTPGRTAVTVVFAVLALIGGAWHRRRDPRTFAATLVLLICGSLGVVLYLNLKAGPSFGWGVLPDGAPREARERDYFFVLGFWAWGMWAGMGAVALARRKAKPWLGAIVAALPIALNWSAVDRRPEPEASMPRVLAQGLLEPLPRGSVLFVSGDNDTYPLWYMQRVEGLRPDVVVVTVPLLNAAWYEAELARRYGLLQAGYFGDPYVTEPEIAASARRFRRPVAAAVTLPQIDRNRIAKHWTVTGMVVLADHANEDRASLESTVTVDTPTTRAWSRRIARWTGGRAARASVDPVSEYFGRVLQCPAWIADSTPSARRTVSLDSLCNLR